MTPITIPHWFEVGLKLTSKWISDGDNTCTILGYNTTTNICQVRVKTPFTEFTEDNWNLQHTLWGFENGDYIEE